MAESATQDESNALYRFMCENIVGSEEHVKTIRMRNNVRDNLLNIKQCTPIISGSFGEGLEMKGSDLDIVKVIKGVEICEDANFRRKHGTVYFIMQTEDTQPGYTQLRLMYPEDQSVLRGCDKIGCDYYYSRLLSKQQQLLSDVLTTMHGPCISDVRKILDVVYGLHSKSWITPAKQWITRSNNSWPVCEVKQSILKHGVLFVPIGGKGSINTNLEWRISFSVGEKLLIFTFTHTQLLCYALMKILLKDVIDLDEKWEEWLCSYFIKTVMLWISEELSTLIWRPENLISCFMICFRRLIYYVKFAVCPHYFIPKNNLFENKIKGHVQEMILNKLNSLNNYGWKCIFFSEQISKFDKSIYGITKEPRLSHVRSVGASLCSIIHFVDNMPWNNTLFLEKGIHRMLSTKSSKIKSINAYYTSKLCCRSAQLLPFDGISDNKFTYKQYKTCVSTLLLGTRHDVVSGWLLLASFFYKTKEYTKAVDVIQYCLLKCTPEKPYRSMNLSHFHGESFNLPLFREMNTVPLLKFLHLECVFFVPNSLLVPEELRIQGKFNELDIPPLIYAHLLCFLCNYNLYNTKQCMDCIRDLQLTIENNYLIPNPLQKAYSYNMLGITFQLIGDTDSARQAFKNYIQIQHKIMRQED